jgi:hypothetical protein
MIQFFIMYVPSQPLQVANYLNRRHWTQKSLWHDSIFYYVCAKSAATSGQLQTQHSVDTGNYIKDEHNIIIIILILFNYLFTFNSILIILIIIQFNLYVFTCKRNSPKANYKARRKKQLQNTNRIKKGSLYSNNKNNNNNLIFYNDNNEYL